jgi:hypothetical protein
MGLLDNPQFPVAPIIDEITDGSRQVFPSYVSNRPSSVIGPKHLSGSQLRLTRPEAQNTSTFSIPIDSSGIRNSAVFFRCKWPSNYLYPPNQTMPSFDPYILPPFWNRPSTGRYGQGTPLDPSTREDIKALTNYVIKFQAITKAQHLELGNHLSLLEKEDISPIINYRSILPAPDTRYCPHVKLYA